MKTAKRPAAKRPTIRNANRVWQLWKAGEGRRTIEHFYHGDQSTAFVLRTKRVKNRQPNGTTKTTVVWKAYDDTGHCYGEFGSDVAAFKTLIDGRYTAKSLY